MFLSFLIYIYSRNVAINYTVTIMKQTIQTIYKSYHTITDFDCLLTYPGATATYLHPFHPISPTSLLSKIKSNVTQGTVGKADMT